MSADDAAKAGSIFKLNSSWTQYPQNRTMAAAASGQLAATAARQGAAAAALHALLDAMPDSASLWRSRTRRGPVWSMDVTTRHEPDAFRRHG
eukprot:3221424-Prymnesium_polylepis.1